MLDFVLLLLAESLRAMRGENRFLAREKTVPVSLIYSTDNRETAQNVISTRVSSNTDPEQVRAFIFYYLVCIICVSAEHPFLLVHLRP